MPRPPRSAARRSSSVLAFVAPAAHRHDREASGCGRSKPATNTPAARGQRPGRAADDVARAPPGVAVAVRRDRPAAGRARERRAAGGGSRGGSRGPTGRCSGPRRPRAARSRARAQRAQEARRCGSARARRRRSRSSPRRAPARAARRRSSARQLELMKVAADPARGQRVHLVLHQRDQGRDDEGEAAVVDERGELVAEATCRRRWASRQQRLAGQRPRARPPAAPGGRRRSRSARAGRRR